MNVCQKRFLNARRGLNPQPYDDWWDALTIKLSTLRWRAKVQVWHMCDLSGSHDRLMLYKTGFYQVFCKIITIHISSGCHLTSLGTKLLQDVWHCFWRSWQARGKYSWLFLTYWVNWTRCLTSFKLFVTICYLLWTVIDGDITSVACVYK